MGGTLSTSNQNNANNVQSSLTASLAGFTVLSSSATVYYGSDPYTPPADSPPEATATAANVGLIVGVVVGSVVFIAILVVIIYKCKTAAATKAVSDATPISQHEVTNGVVVEKY